eukprot:190175-Prorocentrum_minimum.AAC.7
MQASDRFNINSQLEHLQAKYVGTGHADVNRFEWAVNIHRDSYASYVGHHPMLAYFAIAENESIGRVRFTPLVFLGIIQRTPPELEITHLVNDLCDHWDSCGLLGVAFTDIVRSGNGRREGRNPTSFLVEKEGRLELGTIFVILLDQGGVIRFQPIGTADIGTLVTDVQSQCD